MEIGVDEIKPHCFLFHRDDPTLQRWASVAATEADDASVRLESVELLSGKPCAAGKGALMASLRDANFSVRQRALGALEACAHDPAVQSAVVQLLQTDRNPTLRMEAIEFFVPLNGPITVRRQFAGALQGVVERESDGHVRSKCLHVLGEIKASPVTY